MLSFIKGLFSKCFFECLMKHELLFCVIQGWICQYLPGQKKIQIAWIFLHFCWLNETDSHVTFYHDMYQTENSMIKLSSKQHVMYSKKCKKIWSDFEWVVKISSLQIFNGKKCLMPNIWNTKSCMAFCCNIFLLLPILWISPNRVVLTPCNW